MATVTLSQTAESTVNVKQFTALEQKVDALVAQLHQLLPQQGQNQQKSKNGRNNGFRSGQISRVPSFQRLNRPLTPESLPETPDVQTPAVQPVLDQADSVVFTERPSAKLAIDILDIIQRYGNNTVSGDVLWPGKAKFMPVVEACVVKNEPIRMVLPAFPFKSPNRRDKTLGSEVDLGEELALMHLNGLCESICEIYDHGASVVIASDGLVYNDLMGIEDSEVWDYGTGIRNIVKRKGLNHISAFRIVDLLNHPNTDRLTREEYLIHAGCYRRELVARFAPRNFDSHAAVVEEEDTRMTYRGYIKFLTKDLMYTKLATDTMNMPNPKKRYKEAIETLAYQMITRGKAFAAAIEDKCGDYVRLSIHPSSGKTKLSVPLIPPPAGGQLMTPWHSSVAVGVDGTFRTVHAANVRETHDLIYQDGRPYYFREKSPLFDFGDLKVEFEHLYPGGLIIRPAAGTGTAPSFKEVDVKKVRKLAEIQSPVVLRGFADTTNRELFINKASEIGEVLPRQAGGLVQEVKDKLHINIMNSESMPMHFDGMYKFVSKKDEKGNEIKDEQGKEIKVQKPPKFQYYTSVAAATKGTVYSLFAASRLFFKYLPAPYSLERLEAARWRLEDGFGDAKISNHPMVVPHPETRAPCLRWHESWPASKTNFSTCEMSIENDTQDLVQLVDQLLYDRRVCLRFTWEQGDILLSDNTAMLHARSAFTGDSDRELLVKYRRYDASSIERDIKVVGSRGTPLGIGASDRHRSFGEESAVFGSLTPKKDVDQSRRNIDISVVSTDLRIKRGPTLQPRFLGFTRLWEDYHLSLDHFQAISPSVYAAYAFIKLFSGLGQVIRKHWSKKPPLSRFQVRYGSIRILAESGNQSIPWAVVMDLIRELQAAVKRGLLGFYSLRLRDVNGVLITFAVTMVGVVVARAGLPEVEGGDSFVNNIIA
ncbi:MAG: hypothetical protein Q9219_006495 [cf. Caloplaca sp. 3 TL-2023]